MFDLGWTEMMVVGIVALIVVGPKDLPGLFRKVGNFMGKAKGMARDFTRAMNDAADETGIKDMAKGLKAATNPVGSALDGVKEATSDLTSSLDPTKLGPETSKLSAERAASARKIQASTARAAATRKAREAKEAMAKAEEAEAVVAEAEAEEQAEAAPAPTPAKDAESKS